MMATTNRMRNEDSTSSSNNAVDSSSTPHVMTTTTTPIPVYDPAMKNPGKVVMKRRLTTTIQSHNKELQEKPPKVSYMSFLCGITSGVIQAGLFNPWDRALYLSIKNETPFLSKVNFQNPYLGFFQSVGHRALSGGLYYPLENFFCSLLVPLNSEIAGAHSSDNNFVQYLKLHPALSNFLAGTLAGSVNALIVNPITAIKYKSWGRETNRGMIQEGIEMFRKGGIRPFGNGLMPTVLRDLIFGGTYTFLRLEIQYRCQLVPQQQWIANMVAAGMATIVSGPFNLARNVQYATKSRHKADTIGKVLHDFVTETKTRPILIEKIKYIQNRLRIGWGTVRVAVGMAFGHYIYDKLMGLYEDSQLEHQQQH